MEQCIFCQISSKQIPANIVYEDNFSVAFLDIHPRSKGMTIVASKQHYLDFDENTDLSFKALQAALLVGEKIKKALSPKSVSFSILPSSQVPHFHIRVYPIFENEMPIIEGQPIEVSEEEMKEMAQKIREVRLVSEEKVEEEKKEEKPKKRSKEETYWIRREIELA